MTESTHIPTLKARLDAVAEWLYEHAPYTEVDQKHLDAGSTAQAYWHLGYQSALRDVIDLFARHRASPDNAGTSNPYFPNGQDD